MTKWTSVFSVQLLVGHHAHSHHDICIITFIHGVIIINNVHLFSGRFEGLPSLVESLPGIKPMYIENVSLTTVSIASNNYIVTSLASFLEEDSLLGVGSSIIHSHVIPPKYNIDHIPCTRNFHQAYRCLYY